MALSLGISTMFPPVFMFSAPIPRAIYAIAKPAFTNSLSSSHLTLGVYSIIGAIALSFLTDNIGVQRNYVFHNGDSLWEAPIGPTATRIPSSTPTSLSPECLRSKQIFAIVATICAFLVGSAYVMYLGGRASQNSSEPAGNHQHSVQRDRRSDPAPWPLPPPGSQPPNRSFGPERGRPRRDSQPLRTPTREDPPPPPPPPPPSLSGFIQDFPMPRNLEEFIAMNLFIGAISGWILKKLIGYFRGRKVSQKTETIPSSLPKRATASSIPRQTGDRSRSSRSRSPERRQTPLSLDLQRSRRPFSVVVLFALAGSGFVALFRLKTRRRAIKVEHDSNLLIDSNFAYPVPNYKEHPANASYPSWSPNPQTTPVFSWQHPATHRSANDRVRLSKVQQVKYFYKDEIIGFDNGPPPRARARSIS